MAKSSEMLSKCCPSCKKSPSQIPERAIKVIRDYVAALRFPFLRGPSSKLKQIGILLAQMPFFVLRRRLRKRAFDAPQYHKKIAQPKVARFASFRDSVGRKIVFRHFLSSE